MGHSALMVAVIVAVIETYRVRASSSVLGSSFVLRASCATVGVTVDPATAAVFVSNWTLLAAADWTIPLTASPSVVGADAGIALSTTQLLGASGASTPLTCVPAAGCVITGNATDIVVINGTHAGFGDSEDWDLSVRNSVTPGALCGFTWTVTRRWRSGSPALLSSRQALGFVTTGAPPIHGYQIPSWLDPAGAFFNTSAPGAGYPLPGGGSTWYEYGSVNATQLTRWAPVDVHAVMGFTAMLSPPAIGPCAAARGAFFSSAKAPADGTATFMSLGGQAIDRRSAAAAACFLPAGTTETMTLKYDVVYNGSSAVVGASASTVWAGESSCASQCWPRMPVSIFPSPPPPCCRSLSAVELHAAAATCDAVVTAD